MNKKWMAIPALLMLTMTGAIANPPPAMELNRATTSEIVDTLVAKLNTHYVFPESPRLS